MDIGRRIADRVSIAAIAQPYRSAALWNVKILSSMWT